MRDKSQKHQFLSRRYSSLGFSLIELMIALLISLIVIAAVGYIYVGNRAAFRTQTADSRMTDNGRIAIEYLSRELRQSAKLGCTRPKPDNKFGTTLVTATPAVMSATNDTQLNAILLPIISGTNVRALDPGAVVRSYDDGASYTGPVLSDDSPRRPNTDILEIIKAGDTSSHLATPMTVSGPNPVLQTIIPGAAPTAPSQLFVISDCTTTEIFRASVNPNAAEGGSLSLSNPAWNVNGALSESYGIDATVSRFEPVIYMVQNAGAAGTVSTPRLVRFSLTNTGSWQTVPQIIADGIEDLQIRFGVVSSGLAANAPDRYMTATEINATDTELWRSVRSAEIRLVVISERDRVGTTVNARVNEPGQASDTRLRQQIVQVVSLRNAPQ